MMTPELRPAMQCSNKLEFPVLSPWPLGLPGVALGGWVIAGFSSDLVIDYPWADHDPKEFVRLFSSVHPHLSFGELVEFSDQVKAHEPETKMISQAMGDLIAHYGFRDEELFRRLGEKLQRAPSLFRQWAIARKVAPGDLTCLFSVTPAIEPQLSPLLEEIAKRQMTRQEGARALETIVELLLKDPNLSLTQLVVADKQAWLEHLHQLRYPQTSQQDRLASTWVTEQIWPRQSHIRWIRQGDQAGLEVRMMIRQPQDFDKSKDSLERIQKIFEQAPDNVWPKH